MVTELDEARKIIVGEQVDFEVKFTEKNGVIQAESTAFNANYETDAYEMMESAVSAKHYQRVSPYLLRSIPDSGYAYFVCDVIKLNMNAINIHDHPIMPFVDDKSIIGKWEILGEYAVKNDFFGIL